MGELPMPLKISCIESKARLNRHGHIAICPWFATALAHNPLSESTFPTSLTC
jgi:hypothetical protein